MINGNYYLKQSMCPEGDVLNAENVMSATSGLAIKTTALVTNALS